MAFDTFLDIPEVPGEATAKGMEGKIEIGGFNFSALNPTTVGSGGTGLSAGKVSITNFVISKNTDKSSPKLFKACCSGQHYPKATVTARKAAGAAGQAAFLTYVFEDVMVAGISWSASKEEKDNTPKEVVTLAFGKVTATYQQQDSKGGSVGNPVVGDWDLTTVSGGA